MDLGTGQQVFSKSRRSTSHNLKFRSSRNLMSCLLPRVQGQQNWANRIFVGCCALYNEDWPSPRFRKTQPRLRGSNRFLGVSPEHLKIHTLTPATSPSTQCGIRCSVHHWTQKAFKIQAILSKPRVLNNFWIPGIRKLWAATSFRIFETKTVGSSLFWIFESKHWGVWFVFGFPTSSHDMWKYL